MGMEARGNDRVARFETRAQLRIVARNPKAFYDYFIDETYEAGIELLGPEVKSLREGRINLKESFARVEGEEVWLYHCHISPYSHGNIFNREPDRKRRLLLHREEIRRLIGKTTQRGFTLIPLKAYFKGGWAKVELGLAKGKKEFDRREAIAKKSARREIERAVRGRR